MQKRSYATPEYVNGMREDIQQLKLEVQKIKDSNDLAIVQNKLESQLMAERIIERTTNRFKDLRKVEVKVKLKKRGKAKNIAKPKKIRRVIRKKRARKLVKKKVARKVTRSKINKDLLKSKLRKTEIDDYNTALIVTEKRFQKYGRAVFDVARKMNGNVVMIMQEKMSEDDGFEPVTYDAIDNSEAVFIVTNRKMKKNFAIKNAALKRRVFLVNNKLKFSEVKY